MKEKFKMLIKIMVISIGINIFMPIEQPIHISANQSHAATSEELTFTNIDYTKKNDIRVIMDNKLISFNVPPKNINGTMLVPMRDIFVALGLTVNWNETTKIAIGTSAENIFKFTIGSNKALVNNIQKNLDVPASIINGKTMFPLRFLSENMGYNVVWVGTSNLILLSKKDIIEWRYAGYQGSYPHKEYEVKFVNGNKTNETRFNGRNHRIYQIVSVKENMFSDQDIDGKKVSLTFYEENNSISLFGDYDYENVVLTLGNVYYNKLTKSHRVFEVTLNKDKDFDVKNSLKANEVYIGSAIKKNKSFSYENKEFITINENYLKDIELLKSDHTTYVLSKADNLKKELIANNNVPLKVVSAYVSYDSIGTPEANLEFKNLTAKTIIAFEVTIYCYDDFNRPATNWSDSNAFYGISQNDYIKSGEIDGGYWTLYLYDLTTNVKNVKITAVKYSDGTTWKK